MVAFDADPRAYRDSNAYIIAEQGKPPDFVLEIASAATADNDTGHKRLWYARVGNPGILAVRRDGQRPRRQTGRRPSGGGPVRARRHRGTGGRRPAGI